MRNINKKIVIALVVVLAAGSAIFILRGKKNSGAEVIREISPHLGPIQSLISSTGSVLPQNRLEIKPPVAGRIESILVKEGDTVAKGQTIGWLSSTERAALLDAAQGQGEEKLKYWQEAYKAIALVAPIDGQVIVATIQPGQTVTTAEAALVLSDKLIVRAQVDETDIGKIKAGQKAYITLDAYPDDRIPASVEHIYYESTTVNNVTIYEVDLLPDKVPEYFRSGMNANVDFVIAGKENALLLPQEAVNSDNGTDFVLVRRESGKEPAIQPVTLGLAQDKNVEIVSGLKESDTVVIRSMKFELSASSLGKNPFMPSRPRSSTRSR